MRPHNTLGGILLIAGTAIGAGMIALPLATASMGFLQSTLLFGLCWLFMTLSAFLLLEVNLCVAPGANLNSLAAKTIGHLGQIFAWITYLLLLYALTAAYIAGGSAWLSEHLNQAFQLPLSEREAALGFTLATATAVYGGTRCSDYINRLLMLGLIGSFGYLLWLLGGHVQAKALLTSHQSLNLLPLPLLATAFGYHIVIPTLTQYIGDIPTLRRILWLGSLIPLLFYCVWEALVLGALPFEGPQGLLTMAQSPDPIPALSKALSALIHHPISDIASTFLFFAISTSFLGVTLSLFDFLRDALNLPGHRHRLKLTMLTFFPPLAVILVFPAGFFFTLQFAGLFVALLLGVLPVWMAWCARAHSTSQTIPYRVWGGKPLLIAVLSFFTLVSILECQHVYHSLRFTL